MSHSRMCVWEGRWFPLRRLVSFRFDNCFDNCVRL